MTRMTREDSKFDSILTEAIDEALSACGERAKSAFYTYLEKSLSLPKREIPTRIDEFSQALENLFGVGARILEILIMKSLYSRIGVVWKWKVPERAGPRDCPHAQDLPHLTFQEYVNLTKKYYEVAAREEEQMASGSMNKKRVKCIDEETARATV